MWTYNNKVVTEIPEGCYGFIYEIESLLSGRKYIGRKKFTSVRRVKVKNKKNRKVVTKESDWKTYTGSCDELNNEIKEHGSDKFKFKILAFAQTEGQLGYLEEAAHYKYNVLLDPCYYNTAIGSGRKMNVKTTESFYQVVKNL